MYTNTKYTILEIHSINRSSCYTDSNGPEVSMQCSTKWIRNFDTSMDVYGD